MKKTKKLVCFLITALFTVTFGISGSAAAAVGDANGDGLFNAKDMLTARQYLANYDVTITLSGADINFDELVNAKDVLCMREVLAKIIPLPTAPDYETLGIQALEGITEPLKIQPEDIGFAGIDIYPVGEDKYNIARTVWDMHAYDGKIFLAQGNYRSNTGDVEPVWYNSRTAQTRYRGSLGTQALERFFTIDGELYTLGTDPSRYGVGEMYHYSKKWNRFITTEQPPTFIHVYDMLKYHDKYFISGNALDYDGVSSVTVSDNPTGPYKSVWSYLNGEKMAGLIKSYRFYDMWVLNDTLYTWHGYGTPSTVVYRYNEQKNILENDSELNFKPIQDQFNQGDSFPFSDAEIVMAKGNYLDKMVFICDKVFITGDMKQYDTLDIPQDYHAFDMEIINGKVYISCTKQLENGYDNILLRTDDLKTVQTVFSVKTQSFIRSFAYCDGYIWFATGTSRENTNPDSGHVYRYKLA